MASPSPAADPPNQPSEQQGGVGMNMDMDMNMNMNKGLKPSYSGPAINLMQQQYHQTPSSPLPYPITSYPSSYSSSYPPPTGPPFHLHPISSFPSPPPPALSPPTSVGGGAVLMDMLTNLNLNLNLNLSTAATSGPSGPPPPHRMLSSKLPKGRHLIGDRPVYDISVRLKGEVQPQLEVTPITKYVSDPALILGRQIAVNRSYICYGLKPGTIRILNINTALRALLRGHNQKVTDMAFFAEDVHLLASACVGGLVFVRKISEGPDEEDKPQIFEKIVLAIQIVADAELLHPRVCWHPHKQEILMVSIGKSILKIDTNKVGRGEAFSADKPLNCPVDKCIEGVQLVGKHASEVTELSMCQWMTTRLASASTDGMVKIWEDRKEVPLAILRPHDGNPVNSVSFLTAPHRPDHVVLVTGGPYNHEIKIWSSESEEGWLLPSDAESWRCSQTLILKSSGESSVEDAFFNKVVALPRAGLVLLANAKKNAIYAVHIDYGPYPATTRMDYIAEFTVTMPILSLTGTSDSLPNGEHVIQVYCVQKQAIQQYALDLAQCLPPPLEKLELEKTESNVSATFDAATSTSSSFTESSSRPVKMPVNKMEVPAISNRSESSIAMSYPGSFASSEVAGVSDITSSSMQTKTSFMPLHNNEETTNAGSPLHPLSPRLSRKISGLLSPSRSAELIARVTDHAVHDYSVDPKMGSLNENVSDVPSAYTSKKGDKMVTETNTSLPEPPLMFKQPTHLITPSEILSRAVSSENSHIIQGMKAGETIRDVIIKNNAESNEVEVKVVGEASNSQDHDFDLRGDAHIPVVEKKEKSFYSQASDLSYQMTRDSYLEGSSVGRIREANEANVPKRSGSPLKNCDAEDLNMPKDASTKFNELKAPTAVIQSQEAVMKTKKTKEKASEVSGPSSSSPHSLKSSHLSNELSCNSVVPCNDAALSQLSALQGTLNQLINMQKEMQKEMNTMISVPVSKQGKKLEASLGQSVEKVVKSNTDALWARFQEENMKHEKLEEDRALQLTNLINNCTSKDLPTEVEKILKKETAVIGPAVVRAIIPTLEKAISSAIVESFQKGVGDKAITQLEKSVNSKVEATFARQIQSQFQTTGKQVLQDALRSSLETSIIPAFEMSSKAMFDQVHATFQTGLVKHLNASLQQFDSMHSPLVNALRDTINSASSITQTMSGELADGQRKILAIAASGANVGSPSSSFSNGPFTGLHEVAEASLDPTKELLRLIAERKYEEAFTDALHRSNVTIVSWLCSQIDLQGILSMSPLPLSQRVLLALLQQLACDIGNETSKKLGWMRDVAAAINPTDPTIALHVRPIFEQVCQIVNHQRSLPSNVSASEASGIRILLLVINSVLASCK